METTFIPGYAEMLKREHDSRLSAWDDAWQPVCGIVVLPMTLRRLGMLRRLRNGYFVPCKFDNEKEAHAHARQVAWICAPEFFIPHTKIEAIRYTFRQAVWLCEVNQVNAAVFTKELLKFIDEEFFDSPFHGGGDDATPERTQPLAADVAYVADMFARAGYAWSLDDVLDLPLRRLWQFTRVIHQREGRTLPNRSTVLAVKHVATLSKKTT